MPRLLLINPVRHDLGWVRFFQLPPLPILQVAGATPPDWEITLADETVEEVPRKADGYDLVGITCMTHQSPRAYELADRYRGAGTAVVLGGIHPTVLPGEASAHCDSVVVGEAEPVWEQVLSDALEGRLAPVYEAPAPQGRSLKIPRANRRILDGKRYLTRQTLQTTRGCPFDCPFCTVTPYYGRMFRHRPAEEVLAEVASLEREFVLFLDDDIFSEPEQAKVLLRGLARLDKTWASQATAKFAEDQELVDLAAASGCIGLFVGVESVPHGKAPTISKNRRVSEMVNSLRRIQDAGIFVEGSFIFGLDTDDEGVFERTVRFVEDVGLCNATFHILTPYPGTRLFTEFDEQGRLLHKEWIRYNHNEVVFRPAQMSPERLYRGWVEARRAIYSWGSIFSRVSRLRKNKLTGFAYNVLRKSPNDQLDEEHPTST